MGVRLHGMECPNFLAIVIPGFFWKFAVRRGWPVLLAKSLWLRHRWLTAVLGIGLSGVLALGASIWFLALPWFPPIGDCGGRPLLDDYGVPRGIDFTARLIFVGPRTYFGPISLVTRKRRRALFRLTRESHCPARVFPAARSIQPILC
jgi:hypothetical protein